MDCQDEEKTEVVIIGKTITSTFVLPEFCNIYIDLEKYYCQSSQTSKWNFTCEGEETIVISGRDLFKILQKLVKDYESGNN